MKTLFKAIWLLAILSTAANAQKISDLTAGSTTDSGDLFMFVDVSDTTLAATGTNKKITWAEMVAEVVLDIATDYQPLDADLTTWATVTPSANGQALVSAAGYSAMKALLDLEAGTDFYSIAAADAAFQPLDGYLTDISAITGAQGDVIYFNGTDWVNLGAGTSGYFLQTQGAGANPQWAAATFDPTAQDALTWSDGANASNIWTFDVSGTDPTITFGSGAVTIGGQLGGTTLAIGGTAVTATATEINSLAGLSANMDTMLSSSDYADFRANVGLDIGVDVQAYDADLTTYAGITPSADTQDFLGATNYADMLARLDLEIGTDVQAWDADLDTIAALVDPDADRMVFWDDSAGAYTYLTAGTGLTITGTTIAAAAADFSSVAEDILPDADSTRDLGATGNRWAEIWADLITVTDMTVTTLTSNNFEFEGATADAFETVLTVTDPTADRTVTLPDATGTVALVAGDLGAATATTPSANDNDTSVATTAYVQTELAAEVETDAWIIACSDETTDLTTGTAKVTFRAPYAATITGVRASATTAPTGATLTVDINETATTILSTKLTIDATEKTSTTAATAAVISDSAIADDAEITIDIDQIGSTIAGAGLKVTILHTH